MQTEIGEDATHAERLSRGLEPVTTGEWIMAGLGAFNVLILLLEDAYAAFLPNIVSQLVVPVDLALVAIFAVELVVRVSKASSKIGYLTTHWYDVVGLVPIASVGFRAFRLVRFVRIFVVQRMDWTREANWHTALVRGVIVRFRDVLLEEITDPIMMAGIRVIKAPLKRARFASVLASTLETQRRQVHAVVAASLRNTKGLKRVTDTRYGRRLTEAITDAALDSVVDTLHSDEMNDLVANSVEDVLTEVARNVKETGYQAVERASGPLGGGGRPRPSVTAPVADPTGAGPGER